MWLFFSSTAAPKYSYGRRYYKSSDISGGVDRFLCCILKAFLLFVAFADRLAALLIVGVGDVLVLVPALLSSLSLSCPCSCPCPCPVLSLYWTVASALQ